MGSAFQLPRIACKRIRLLSIVKWKMPDIEETPLPAGLLIIFHVYTISQRGWLKVAQSGSKWLIFVTKSLNLVFFPQFAAKNQAPGLTTCSLFCVLPSPSGLCCSSITIPQNSRTWKKVCFQRSLSTSRISFPAPRRRSRISDFLNFPGSKPRLSIFATRCRRTWHLPGEGRTLEPFPKGE